MNVLVVGANGQLGAASCRSLVARGEGSGVGAPPLVRSGGFGLDGVGMDVLEELEATVAVGRLEHGDVRVVAVQADCRVGPLPTDRVTTEEGEPQVGEERDRRIQVVHGDTDVLELDGHVVQATQPRATWPDRELNRRVRIVARNSAARVAGAAVDRVDQCAGGQGVGPSHAGTDACT